MISATSTASAQIATLAGVATPVLTTASVFLDELGMTGTGGVNQGTSLNQASVAVSAAGQSHDLGAGFPAGTVAIASSATMSHGWGKPNSNAVVAATITGDATKAAVFGYDTGATMVSGTATARRVNYPLSGGLATNINDNGVQLFDAAVAWASGKSPKIAYKRDATDRITERTVNGRVVARYSYTASGDTSDLTLDGSNNRVEASLALPGGALYTWRTATPVWSYANTHGDIVVTANTAGVKQGPTRAYDPYGQPLTTTAELDNSAGEFDYGWLGEHQRPLEHHSGSIPVIEMGARQYDPLPRTIHRSRPRRGWISQRLRLRERRPHQQHRPERGMVSRRVRRHNLHPLCEGQVRAVRPCAASDSPEDPGQARHQLVDSEVVDL